MLEMEDKVKTIVHPNSTKQFSWALLELLASASSKDSL